MTKLFITDSRKIGESDRENRKLIGGSGRKLQSKLQVLVDNWQFTLSTSKNYYLARDCKFSSGVSAIGIAFV